LKGVGRIFFLSLFTIGRIFQKTLIYCWAHFFLWLFTIGRIFEKNWAHFCRNHLVTLFGSLPTFMGLHQMLSVIKELLLIPIEK